MLITKQRPQDIPDIDPEKVVKVKECGNIIEVMSREHRSFGAHILKISAEEYVLLKTGEVKPFNHTESRADNLSMVARSLAYGRDMINANITDVTMCRWLTLTYAENMTDPRRLYEDFKEFNRRARKKWGHYEYITAAEPQGRGAWHLHAVLIFDHKAPYMANAAVADCWRKGFVTIKRLDDVDNVGAYLTAYLGDMELHECAAQGMTIHGEGVKLVEYTEEGQKKSKAYIKGARMRLYPPQFHIFRWSRGCKKPIIEQMTYGRAQKEKALVGARTFRRAVLIEDDKSDFRDLVVYEYYNKCRGKCQEKSDNL